MALFVNKIWKATCPESRLVDFCLPWFHVVCRDAAIGAHHATASEGVASFAPSWLGSEAVQWSAVFVVDNSLEARLIPCRTTLQLALKRKG